MKMLRVSNQQCWQQAYDRSLAASLSHTNIIWISDTVQNTINIQQPDQVWSYEYQHIISEYDIGIWDFVGKSNLIYQWVWVFECGLCVLACVYVLDLSHRSRNDGWKEAFVL